MLCMCGLAKYKEYGLTKGDIVYFIQGDILF